MRKALQQQPMQTHQMGAGNGAFTLKAKGPLKTYLKGLSQLVISVGVVQVLDVKVAVCQLVMLVPLVLQQVSALCKTVHCTG